MPSRKPSKSSESGGDPHEGNSGENKYSLSIYIALDLSMVKFIADRTGVLHYGHLVETGTTDEIFSNPVHPYTKSLLSAIPHPDPITERDRIAMNYNYLESGIDYNKGTLVAIGLNSI